MPLHGGKVGSMAEDINLTTDHDEIRRWAERVGGRPVQVRLSGAGTEVGVLSIDLPEGGGTGGEVEPLSWDDWFDRFDAEGLALLYEEQPEGARSPFNKLVQR